MTKKRIILISVLSAIVVLAVATGITLALTLSGGDKNVELIDNRKIVLSQSELEIELGETGRIEASLSVGKGKIGYSSSDESVATVSALGEVRALSIGTCEITATCAAMSAKCVVSVVLPDGFPVFKDKTLYLDVKVGESKKADAAVTFNGSDVESENYFRSDDEKIAEVDETGLITAVSEGETIITVTATYQGLTQCKRITVRVYDKFTYETTDKKVRLDLMPDEANGYRSSAELKIRAFYELEDVTGSISDVKWTSKNSAIAVVSALPADGSAAEKATVEAVSSGTTEVIFSFSYSGKEYSEKFEISCEKSTFGTTGLLAYDGRGEDSGKIILPFALPSAFTVTSGKFTAKAGDSELELLDYDEEKGEFAFKADAAVEKGERTIVLSDEKWEYTLSEVLYCSAVLTQASHDELMPKGVIPAGEVYALAEDIDLGFSGADEGIQIAGTLDGRGHALRGITFGVKPKGGWTPDPKDGTQSYSAYIEYLTGTIRNLRIEFEAKDFPSGDAPSFLAPIYNNSGTIENVLSVASFYDNGWFVSGLIGKNYGAVRNVVTVIPDKGSRFPERITGMICFFNGGYVRNCYTIGNDWAGQTDEDAEYKGKGEQGIFMEQHEGGSQVSGWKGLADVGDLAIDSGFVPSNGWNSFWSITENTVTFGGNEFNLVPTTYLKVGYAEEDYKNVVVDLGDFTAPDDTVPEVRFGNQKMRGVTISGGKLTAKKGGLSYGEYTLRLIYPGMTYVARNVMFVTKVLRNSDVAADESFAKYFKNTLNDDPYGYFVLGEDLDFRNEQTITDKNIGFTGTIDFAGILDGNGYALNNLLIHYDAGSDDGYNSYLFKINDGVIKNLAVNFTVYANGPTAALVKENNGTISNVYANYTLQNAKNEWNAAPLAVKNNGTISNCITVLNVESGKYGKLVPFVVENNTKGVISRCYSITNGYVPSGKLFLDYCNRGASDELETFASEEEFVSEAVLSEKYGWVKYFAINEDGKLVFGR